MGARSHLGGANTSTFGTNQVKVSIFRSYSTGRTSKSREMEDVVRVVSSSSRSILPCQSICSTRSMPGKKSRTAADVLSTSPVMYCRVRPRASTAITFQSAMCNCFFFVSAGR